MIELEIKRIYLVSDGTGETAEKVMRAALKQFSTTPVTVHKFPHITNVESLQGVVQKASSNDVLVLSTLVSTELRNHAREITSSCRVRYIDLLDNLLEQLSMFLRVKPEGIPNKMHQVNDEYFRRIEAVEFTVRGDDGKNPKLLHKADIILVGVSRTSKTPLSVFLAHKGYKVCNIPIVFEHTPPIALSDIDQRRIFGLTIDPDTLQHIRKQRLKTMRVSNRSSYGELDYILAELDWADELFRSNPTWPVIDVTQRAVEETAAIILKTLSDRGLSHQHNEIGQL